VTLFLKTRDCFLAPDEPVFTEFWSNFNRANFGKRYNNNNNDNNNNNNNNNSVALFRERTIPTERPPLVGEVSAKKIRVLSP
jgi:hypothetical protein